MRLLELWFNSSDKYKFYLQHIKKDLNQLKPLLLLYVLTGNKAYKVLSEALYYLPQYMHEDVIKQCFKYIDKNDLQKLQQVKSDIFIDQRKLKEFHLQIKTIDEFYDIKDALHLGLLYNYRFDKFRDDFKSVNVNDDMYTLSDIIEL